MTIISSGSKSIDKLLGGGIRTGFITDIFGDSKLARNALSLSACISAARIFCDSFVVYIDTGGNFRPELAIDHLDGSDDSDKILRRIIAVRLYSIRLFSSTIRKSLVRRPKMIVIDNFVTLFTNEVDGITKHLSVMHHLRKLAVTALNHDVAIVITNPSVYQKTDYYYAYKKTNQQPTPERLHSKYQEEVLGSTLGIYTHIALKIERSQMKHSAYSIKLVKPVNNSLYHVRISNGRLEELEKE